tara:strand:+ start:50 stop:265 length:216 start_codon:yes stop_codon:yes gene_type:complete
VENLTSKIIAYENGTMDDGEAIAFFQELVDTGVAWSLQGHYGRVASSLIEAGMIKENGGHGTEVVDSPSDV